ncbi:SEC-C metal-binding domain-containing protein [Thiocystis violacea]|uniref:SEC-C metal-binding domain-containing protein n=1 Tax=Thiocystis violacea TaxID=13725 RepID=UPI001F5BD38F|nr:SEC-C metal-binding domain-containing protein [Thiocystis violacea]
MPFDFHQTKDKLTDPTLMDWALSRLHDTQGGTLSQGMPPPTSWLDTDTLQHWLESGDGNMIARLFSVLPAECFAGLKGRIAEHWPLWRGRLAEDSAVVLAQLDPEVAWTCFTQDPSHSDRDNDVALGIVRSLHLLPPDRARVLLQDLARKAADPEGDEWQRGRLRSSLFLYGLAIDAEPLLPLLRSRFSADLGPPSLSEDLATIDAALCGDHSYRELASDIAEHRTDQAFASLAHLFRDDAPLDQLDLWCKEAIDPRDPMDLAERSVQGEARPAVLAVIESLRDRPLGLLSAPVVNFCISSIAAAHAREDIEAETLPLQAVIELLAVDLSPPRHFDALLARLRDFEPAQVTAELKAALEREAPTYGGVTLARVMGHLGWEDFIPALIESLGEDQGDLLQSEAERALARIGEPAGLALLERWDTLDSSQRLYATGTISTMGGEPAVRLVLEHEADLMDDSPAEWSEIVVSAPDPRLLAHLEPMLKRRQDWIDRPFYVLGRLLGSDHPELETIGERARAHRQAQAASIAALKRGELGTASDKLTLQLKCPECGDSNLYDVRRIAVDETDPHSRLVIAEEIPCASCGRYTDLAETQEAKLAIFGELLRLTRLSAGKSPVKSQVLLRILGMRDGRKLPVGQLLSDSEAAVEEDPNRVGEWLRLAHCYQQLLERPRLAARFRAEALQREPNAVEGVLLEASALTKDGEDARAFELLDAALAAKERWRFFVTDIQQPAGVAKDFASLYNHLSRRLGRNDRPTLEASLLTQPKKVGRNDPCPCGSGKKYKKCCLARG